MVKVYTYSELPKAGVFVMIYGDTGYGKTVTSLKTLPKKVMWITTEPRSLSKPIEAAIEPPEPINEDDVVVAPYTNFIEIIDFLSNHKNFDGVKSIFFDSLSYCQSIRLSTETIDEISDRGKGITKNILNSSKITQEGVGLVNNSVFRISNLLGKLSEAGKVVVVSCLVTERPKWNRELEAAPMLTGKQVPDQLPGCFDLIGYVTPRKDSDGNRIYPPYVSFEEGNGYLAKFTGKGNRKSGPLDFSKILVL